MTAAEEERRAELQRVIAILHKWGIHSLGQFAALPKEDVAFRLGPEAVRMWERATGTASRPLRWIQPPESFLESFEFENEIETSEPLLFMLRRFLQQFAARFGALYLVAKELRLHITFSDPPQDGSAAAGKNRYEHRFEIPQPSNNIETLFRMLQTHLENFRSESPIIAVALEAVPIKPGSQQFSLFETTLRDPAQLSETMARLVGLLGSDHVGRPILEDTYQADAFRMETFSWELPEPSAIPPHSPRFALRRFRPDGAASVLRDGKTLAHLRAGGVQGEIVEQAGPFVSSGNWWDEQAWARAEWDVRLANGAVCRCHLEAEQWQFDGIYD